MSKRPGIIYETDRGDFGLAIHSEQHPKFVKTGRVFLHLFTDRLCTKPKFDSAFGQEPAFTLKHISKLKIIGYSD